MTAVPVEWVLVVYYGPSAHRATYGRLGGTQYTKDYIQLSRTPDFKAAIASLFAANGTGAVPLTYKWPLGSAPGHLILQSADRPHLAWETRLGAPSPWRMSPAPSDETAETIPGDPSHRDFEKAEAELALVGERGAGQPYLVAIKLQGEPRTLHLRTYLADPSEDYVWASTRFLPPEVRSLVATTSQRSALAWLTTSSGGTLPSEKITASLALLAASDTQKSVLDALDPGTGQELAEYLEHPAYGLFFDPGRNHSGWIVPPALPNVVAESIADLLTLLRGRFPASLQSDAEAEKLEVSADEVDAFRQQIKDENYDIADTFATTKTRGSAQRAFSEAVKTNYEGKCAVTGIDTKDFLVAAHIVPWSIDRTIRLDPSNGICLSLLMDRAFEDGYITISDDMVVSVMWDKVGNDFALKKYLEEFDGQKLSIPKIGAPKVDYVRRRRELVA